MIRSSIRTWIAESPSTRDPRFLVYYLRHYGLLKTLGARIYDDQFYAENLLLKEGYVDLAEIIHLNLRPISACDLGCGNALLIDSLKKRGVLVKGVEASHNAFKFTPEGVRGDIATSTITRPLSLGAFDLVICTEVAEHISKSHSVTLIDNLVRHAEQSLFFTAAHPGQWGDGHINCQPKSFWQQLFRERGWHVDEALQNQIARDIDRKPRINQLLPWISENMMILRPLAKMRRHEQNV